MSLELAIQTNTAAIYELIEAITNQRTAQPVESAVKVEEVKTPAKPKKANTDEPKAKAPEQTDVVDESEAEPTITYNELGALVKKAAIENRDEVVAILGKFKAKNLKEIKESDWPKVEKLIRAIGE